MGKTSNANQNKKQIEMKNFISILSTTCILLVTVISVSAGSNEKSKIWLAENAKKEGVISLSSGLQYTVLRQGTGMDHPSVNAPCECHYKGTLTDGTQFDSSYDRGDPTTFAPNQVIKGWTEAMQMMVEGDKWEMYIPSELAYGDSGSPPKIGPGDALIFTMEILKINGDKVPACKVDTMDGCTEKQETYIRKSINKYQGDAALIQGEIDRITRVTISNKGVSQANAEWGSHRVAILQKLLNLPANDNSKDL